MRIYKFIFILLTIFQAPLVAFSDNEDNSTLSIDDGVKKLNKLIEKNSKNNKEGNAHLNQYIFSLTNEESDYIRDFEITEKNKFIDKTTEFVKSINQSLIEFYQTNNIALYICLDGSNIEVLHTAKKWNQSIAKEDLSIFKEGLQSIKSKIETNSEKIFSRSKAGSSSALVTISLVDLVQMLHVINEDKTVTSNKSDDKIKSFYFIHGVHGSGFSKSLIALVKSKLPSKEINSEFFSDSNTTFKRVVEAFKETLLLSSLGDLDINTLCETGKEYFNYYIDLGKTNTLEDKEYLFKVAELVCEEGTEELMEAQKAQYEKWEARAKTVSEVFAQNEFSFKSYYNALINIKNWIETDVNKILTEENRDLLFDAAYALDQEVLSLLTTEQKLELLKILVSENLYNLVTINNQDKLVVKVVESVKDEEASEFLEGLTSDVYKDKNGRHLLYSLKERLTSQDGYRLFDMLYNIWTTSKYATIDEWSSIFDPETSPIVIPYEPIKTSNDLDKFNYFWTYNLQGKLVLNITSHSNNITNRVSASLSFSPFQPLKMISIDDGKMQILTEARPAFYYYARQQAQVNEASVEFTFFMIETHLAILGAGELSIFKQLTNYRKFIAIVDIATASTDITLEYSSICDGNEEVCADIIYFNRLLQYVAVVSNVKFAVDALKGKSRHIIVKANTDANYKVPQKLESAIEEYSGDLKFLANAVGDIWTTIAKQVDDLISPKVNQIKNIYSDSKVGYRGSLATGQKYNNGNPLPFDANDFDVDGFIVSDQLAAQIGNKPFRNAREIPQLNAICDDLESSFISNLPGYRTEIGKPFTLRVYTEAEFLQTVQPNGFKLFD